MKNSVYNIGMNNVIKLLLLLMVVCTVVYADEYTFGDGLQVGDSPVIVSGYVSSMYDVNKHSKIADIDNVALLAYGEFDEYDFLAELEVTDVYKKEYGANANESRSSTFHVERLYGDYYFGDDEQLRIGKFNSDVGFWNQMPINVLRATTSSPNFVKDFFPKLTTGAHYESRESNGLVSRISATLQNNPDLDPGYNNFNIDRHYAVACDVGNKEMLWRFGGGYFRYELTGYKSMYLLGAFKIEKKQWDLLFESIVRHDIEDRKLSYDMYTQGVWHLTEKHDTIFRIEVEKAPLTQLHDANTVLGYTYRPFSNIALKGEYEAHQESELNRWLFSLSVLF